MMWFIVVLSFSIPDAPRALSAWPAGPFEVRVKFDRAVDPEVAARVVGTRIAFGPQGKSADAEGRGAIRVAGAKLADGGRTLVLATDPHPIDATYTLILPEPAGARLSYDLRGVDAAWAAKPDAPATWSARWPTLEPPANADPTPASGRLTLKTLAALPRGKGTLAVHASRPFELSLGNERSQARPDPHAGWTATAAAEIELDATDVVVALDLDGKAPLAIKYTYQQSSQKQPTSLAPASFTLPWAPPTPPSAPETPVPDDLITGGDPTRGAAVFKGPQAKCATCHKFEGAGGDVGPDLTTLFGRDRAWVYRQINEPGAIIHPDYTAYTINLKDGRVLVGVVRALGFDAIRVIDAEARATTVKKDEIDDLRPSATSIMPVGLIAAIGVDGVKDLIAYLTTKPKS